MTPSVLWREIQEQPEVVARFLARERVAAEKLAARLSHRSIPFVLVAARGTSDNAARYAQYALGLAVRLPVALAVPSLTTLYGRPPRLSGALVIGISQSGCSPDVVATVAAARRDGAVTLAIVNDAESPLARAAAEVLPLDAGREESIAATKTYTAELAAVALLAAVLSGRRQALNELQKIPAAMAAALAKATAPAARLSAQLATASRAVVLARGVNYPTAHELALKLKELALLQAEAFSSADFQHGPIAMARLGLPAFVISPPGGRAAAELAALSRLLLKRGSPVIAIGPKGKDSLPVPEVPEHLSPLVAILPGQLLAFFLARARGFDPDHPPRLLKVTRTL